MKTLSFLLGCMLLWAPALGHAQNSYLSPEEVLLLELFGNNSAAPPATSAPASTSAPATTSSNTASSPISLTSPSFASEPIAQTNVGSEPIEELRAAAPPIENPGVIDIPQPTLQPAKVPVQNQRPLAPTGAGSLVLLLALTIGAGWTLWRVTRSEKVVKG